MVVVLSLLPKQVAFYLHVQPALSNRLGIKQLRSFVAIHNTVEENMQPIGRFPVIPNYLSSHLILPGVNVAVKSKAGGETQLEADIEEPLRGLLLLTNGLSLGSRGVAATYISEIMV